MDTRYFQLNQFFNLETNSKMTNTNTKERTPNKQAKKNENLVDVNWNDLSGKIRNAFPSVTDKDLQFMAHGENELIGRLQMKSGKTKSQIRDWVRNSSKII